MKIYRPSGNGSQDCRIAGLQDRRIAGSQDREWGGEEGAMLEEEQRDTRK